MHWIVIALFAIYVGVVIWAALDAYDQTDMGCLWLSLFIVTPVFSVLAYILMRAYVFRRREPEMTLDPRKYQGPLKHFGSEIEKARFIAAASAGPGTMYEPIQRGAPSGGYRHFTDTRAETLIAQGLFGEAFEYLAEMYALARQEKDGRGQDTFLYYIHRLPGGAKLFAQWRKEQLPEPCAADDAPRDPRRDSGAQPDPTSRKVPF